MTHASRFLLAAGLALGGGVVALAPSAQAAACSTTSGVTVVVSFPDHTVVLCDPGNPTSGAQALQGAGFSISRVAPPNVGFLCRISGYPSTQSCNGVPPGNAYWQYFHASRGGSWTAAGTGMDGYDPPAGSVEGWAFGAGARPAVPPPAAPVTSSPKPTPKPTPSRSTPRPTRTSSSKPSSSRPGTTSRSAGTTSAGRTSSGAVRTTAPTRAGSSTTLPTSGTGGPSSTTGSTTTTATALAGGPAGPTDGGANGSSAWPLVGGGGLVAALAAAAAYGARRRRLPQH